ncbi:MAG: hypothetical protein F4X02_07395 [Chloroflexi bacterium]|nr:hypothetical protein [Chloroflexota bacterium]
MKNKSHAPISKAAGCRRLLSISSLALISVFSACALYLFTPVVFYNPQMQRVVDSVRQSIHFPNQAQKETDLIAFVCDHRRGYGSNLYTVHADGTNLQLIDSSSSKIHYSLDWSPDGTWLAMNMKDEGYWSWNRRWAYESHYSEVYSIRFDGSVIKRLTYNQNDEHNPQRSSDGETIFFDSGGLHSVSADGGEIKQINQLRRGSYSLSHNGLLLSILHNTTGDPALDYSLHQDSSGLKLLVSPDAQLFFANLRQWSRNDEAFLYADEYDGLQVFDMKSLLKVNATDLGAGPASWSPNGKLLAIISISDKYAAHGDWIRVSNDGSLDDRSRRYLHLLDVATGQVSAFLQDIKYVPIAWSPDSEWIAFSSASQDNRLFKIRRDGTGLQQLTDLECSMSEISWSPK